MTMFLTLVAFKVAVSTELPRVSYLTILDKHILVQMFLLFAALLVQTTTYLVDREAENPLSEVVAISAIAFILVSVWPLLIHSAHKRNAVLAQAKSIANKHEKAFQRNSIEFTY